MTERTGRGLAVDRRTALSVLAVAGMPGVAQAQGEAPFATIRRMAPAFDRMIAPETQPEVIATGVRWAEGPLWIERGGYLLFSDPPANIVRRWRRGEPVRSFLAPSGDPSPDPATSREPGANGLALDRTGGLLIANSGGRSIDRLDLSTRRRRVVVDRYQGKRFNSPNDMHVARDGAIYFTDPPYGLRDDDRSPVKELDVNGVYRWSEKEGAVLLDGSLTRPNGIALSPDERRLYVAISDADDPRVIAYDLDARGMPGASRTLFSARALHASGAPGLPDGMKVARDGTLVCSGPGGILFLSPEGELLGMVATAKAAANAAFGEKGRALFVTASDRVLRVPLRPGWQG